MNSCVPYRNIKYNIYIMFKCDACEREYTSTGNLNKHLKQNNLCFEWLKQNINETDRYKIIQNDYNITNKIEGFREGEFKCNQCQKCFSTQSNLNKHMIRSVICKKWNDLNINKQTSNNLNNINAENSYIYENNYSSFKPPTDNLIHVIWNIFLCDKYQDINKELIENNKIGYIISILPTKEDYKEYIEPELVKHSTIEYFDNHEETIDAKLLQIYQEQCDQIEIVRKEEYRNIIIFCNNGFQRSIPFICYYLLKYHPNEYSSLVTVLNLVLSKVQNTSTPAYIEEYTQLLSKLCNIFNK